MEQIRNFEWAQDHLNKVLDQSSHDRHENQRKVANEIVSELSKCAHVSLPRQLYGENRAQRNKFDPHQGKREIARRALPMSLRVGGAA